MLLGHGIRSQVSKSFNPKITLAYFLFVFEVWAPNSSYSFDAKFLTSCTYESHHNEHEKHHFH